MNAVVHNEPGCPQVRRSVSRRPPPRGDPERVELPGPGLHLRPRLLAAGYDDAELRVLRRSGAAVTVRPGAYVPADDPRLGEAHGRHLLAVRATAAGLGAGAVISHVSAAVLHGWPVWSVPLRRVHVTRDRASGGRRGVQVHLHLSLIHI